MIDITLPGITPLAENGMTEASWAFLSALATSVGLIVTAWLGSWSSVKKAREDLKIARLSSERKQAEISNNLANDNIQASSLAVSTMKNTVETLRQEIEEKDETIEKLKADLEQANKIIESYQQKQGE